MKCVNIEALYYSVHRIVYFMRNSHSIILSLTMYLIFPVILLFYNKLEFLTLREIILSSYSSEHASEPAS